MPRAKSRANRSHVLSLWVIICSVMGCGVQPDAGLAPDDSLLPASVDDEPDDAPGDVDEPTSEPDEPAPPSDNRPPLAHAGDDLTARAGEVVSLDGSRSSDPDGAPLTYRWTIRDGAAVSLARADTDAPSFTAPVVSADTALLFTLVVSDGATTDSDTVDVLVLAEIEVAQTGPTADAGPDQTVDSGAIVTLDGTASEDEAASLLGFDWIQVSGPPVTLSGPDAHLAGFVAPVAIGTDAVLEFELIVRDGDRTAVDRVLVTVRAQLSQPPAPPVPPPPPPPPPPTDNCPNDPNKTEPGICGCGTPDVDTDGDALADCLDFCANDPAKIAPEVCGCGVSETDRDADGTPDCADGCPDDPTTTNPVFCIDPTAARDSDWELYMLRLVNRARRDPSGEAARIGSGTLDTRAPVPPLAYDLLVAETANNHTDWMHDNFGGISSGRTPDSFSHYETLDGQSTGAPAVGTPSYTGVRVGDRLVTVGYPWSNYGENIQTNYSTTDIPVNKARIDNAHLGWWNSSGHRSNMLATTFTSFGFHIESRAFTPPRGGLSAPFDNLMYATQCFGRPQSGARTYVLGLIYVDRDGDGAWTPRPVGDSLREGLPGVDLQVFLAGTTTSVAAETTLGNGAFSVRLADGVYDLLFTDPMIPSGQLLIEDVAVLGANVDLGDYRVGP